MSHTFWQGVVSAMKTLIENIENELSKAGVFFGRLLDEILTATESQLMADVKPMIQQIAVNLQNAQPGLNAQNFIAALIAASIPVLEEEGIKLSHTAIAIVASTVAHELTVSDSSGNAGTVS